MLILDSKFEIMTDKEKIKTEIARLMTELIQEKEKGYGSDADDACILELQNVLTFIESLQEEPVSMDLEDEIAKFNSNYFPETDNGLNIGMRKELRTIVGNAIKNGVQWKEQQMMQNAIEREVKVDADGYPYIDATELYDYDNDKPLAKAGDKVKVLIIKQ